MITGMNVVASYTSREQARQKARQCGGKVVRAGTFSNGSFGLYAPLKSNGQYVGGVNPLITVWHVVRSSK